MNPGFQTIWMDARTRDFRNFIMLSYVEFLTQDGRLLRAPIAQKTDLGSIPQAFWMELAPFGKLIDGEWRGAKPFILHDADYQNTLEISHDGGATWEKANYNQEQGDLLLREMLISEGFSHAEAEAIFLVLRAVGKKAYDEDRAELK